MADAIATTELITVAKSDLRWLAQTTHHAYHHGHPGAWRECPKATCEWVSQAVEDKR